MSQDYSQNEADQMAQEVQLLQSQLDNTRRDLAEGNRRNALMLEDYRKERELSDQLAERLESALLQLSPDYCLTDGYRQCRAALAQHAAMRAKTESQDLTQSPTKAQ